MPLRAAGIPYPRIETTGANALAEWERLRRAGNGWPVIVGGDEALALIGEQFEAEGNAVAVDVILAASRKIRVPEDLFARLDAERLSEEDKAALAGDWPESPPPETGLTVASDILTGKPHDRVHILLIPTSDGAEVPAYLRWGGWNECPAPEMHVAVLRDWHARYGAELVGLSGDILNLRAKRRPETREAALTLATEQFFYCTDIVEQGVGSTSALAATLMSSDWWFFWWD
ncbi:DUF4253 domain-containing protein [Sphingomonas sp. G-3-2-10]|uniref:DUF4253 domain-containing protein n=1 Tax=Sphingomonas sp. G-3-2-10 TaxID=2728838 RepID=UPI0019D24E6D|nr:DUF4253 domain-containing protein [Sphingomonas sp. G-3-2-10]